MDGVYGYIYTYTQHAKIFCSCTAKTTRTRQKRVSTKKIANLTTDRKQDFKVKNAIELDVLEQNL